MAFPTQKVTNTKYIFWTYQHCCSQIEFVEELRDEDVHLEHVGDVLSLHVPQDVDEPLEVSVRRTDPQEVDLLARNAGIPEWVCVSMRRCKCVV